MTVPWFEVDWPAPRGVRALSTLRGDIRNGVSKAPYGCFNLGDHVGDDPAAVAENRNRLKVGAALPSEPSWLSQVHGIGVADLDLPAALGSRTPQSREDWPRCARYSPLTVCPLSSRATQVIQSPRLTPVGAGWQPE